jgi:hypothetical protein
MIISSVAAARDLAFKYYTSHYGNMIQIGDAVVADGNYAFSLYSNYPFWNEEKAERGPLIKCDGLGEIVVSSTGAIVSATPRGIVVKRLRKCIEEYLGG